jgi:hypothetical protein
MLFGLPMVRLRPPAPRYDAADGGPSDFKGRIASFIEYAADIPEPAILSVCFHTRHD